MIEFAIVFGLGFLAATLLALMLAPAIHRRIVAYTEKRLFATMPISPKEVRAQKDMARALYAAENARLRQELEDERQRSTALRIRHDEEAAFHQTMEADAEVLKADIETLTNEVATLEADIAERAKVNAELASKLEISEEVAAARAKEIQTLSAKVQQIARELDEVKIELAAREVELEQEKSRSLALKGERDSLSKELIGAEAKNKEAANQITRESRKVSTLEIKLAEKAAKDADTETLLERRNAEIARLKERLRAAATHVSGSGSGKLVEDEAYEDALVATNGDTMMVGNTSHEELEEIRIKSVDLANRLLHIKDQSADEDLREELAELAASMVALTAKNEGDASPIRTLLKDSPAAANDQSLAARAKRQIETLGA